MSGSNPRVVALVLAAGTGERLGFSEPKAFLEIGGRSILAVAVESAVSASVVDALVVAVPAGFDERATAVLAGLDKPVRVVAGGPSRHASVDAALGVVPEGCRVVVCHDAARALATPALFTMVVEVLQAAGSAVAAVVPVVPVADTIKRVEGDVIVATEPRESLRAAQTPQAFRTEALRDAHRRAGESGLEFTDDAGAIEWAGGGVRIVDGEARNFKITTADDLARADALLSRSGRG
jgi:2-C-methyl-D-erythritol 4-phosphate cytidylyltransferase